MKQIFNWTIGSFFRTIGRTIALLVLGSLLYYIISFNDIRLTDLFVLKVNAEQIVVPVIPRASEYYYGIPDWSSGWTISSDYNFAQREIWSHNYTQEAWLQFSGTDFTTDVDYLEFSFQINQPFEVITNNNGITSTIYGQDVCERFKCSSWDSNNQCLMWTCDRIISSQDSTITSSTSVSHTTEISNLNIYAEIEYTNGNKPMCTINGSSIICPTNHLTPYKLHIYSYFETTTNTHFNFSISRHVRGYYAQNQQQVIDSINNQTQQQQQQHNEMMNSTTTDAEDEAADFFSDFDVPDVGGLSAIITAPLNTIQSLLSNSCSNLVLPLPFLNENLTLPCLGSIYSQHFGAFFTLYQTIILAIVSYRCIRSIYFDIHGFTDPNDDRIEVMDL